MAPTSHGSEPPGNPGRFSGWRLGALATLMCLASSGLFAPGAAADHGDATPSGVPAEVKDRAVEDLWTESSRTWAVAEGTYRTELFSSPVNFRDDLFVCLLGKLGPRYGEAAALRRRSVNLLARRLTVEESLAEVSGRLVFGPTKTHAMRKLPLPPSLAAAFERHLDERVDASTDALLFTSPKGKPIRYGNFMRTVWKPALMDLGLPDVGIYVLRHSAAAALIRTGASPTAVEEWSRVVERIPVITRRPPDRSARPTVRSRTWRPPERARRARVR
jgi:integrase